MARTFDPADYEWYCDNCDADLYEQDGFDPYCGRWECTECGCVFYINEDALRITEDEDGTWTTECPICGGIMERTGTDSEPWVCTSCNVRAYEDERGLPVVDEDEYEVGDIGCEACGNPAYPDCKTSCSMFDE